ncbi:unnamed protein product, partial [marine sediment metagenome]
MIMPNENIKKKLKNVNQFKIDKNDDIVDLIQSLKNTGFNAKRLALACEIYKEMILDKKCIKFFGLAGALVPAGMQRVIHDFVEEGFIDVLVTTGASLTHDIAETLGYHHLQGEVKIDDYELHKQDLNRIYDVYLPNKVYEGIEDYVKNLDIPDENMPVSSFIKLLGDQLPDNDSSILKICAKKNVPIFCPAFTDSG